MRLSLLPRVDLVAGGLDLSITTLAKDTDELHLKMDRLMGLNKRRRDEDADSEQPGTKTNAELFFGFVRHISCDVDFRRHEIVSLRQAAPYYCTEGAWESGKHAPARLQLEDPVENERNLAQYLNRKTHAHLHMESVRACVLMADGGSWEDMMVPDTLLSSPEGLSSSQVNSLLIAPQGNGDSDSAMADS